MPSMNATPPRAKYHAEFYQANKARIKERNRLRYLAKKSELYQKRKEWIKKNPERELANTRKYRANNLEKCRKASRESNRRHKDAISAYNKVYRVKHYAENRDKILARNAKWVKNNPGKVSAIRHNQRALRRAAIRANVAAIKRWMESVKSQSTAVCYWCKQRVTTDKIHFDHIIPYAKKGSHCPENLCVSCISCNCSKSDKSIREWKKFPQQFLEL